MTFYVRISIKDMSFFKNIAQKRLKNYNTKHDEHYMTIKVGSSTRMLSTLLFCGKCTEISTALTLMQSQNKLH